MFEECIIDRLWTSELHIIEVDSPGFKKTTFALTLPCETILEVTAATIYNLFAGCMNIPILSMEYKWERQEGKE